jgi:hypothetical protein
MEKNIHFNNWDTEQKNKFKLNLTAFADFFIDNFFFSYKIAFIRLSESSLTLIP